MKKDKPRYAGRVEYLAVREQVKGLFEKGYSLAMVFRELSGAGKITMSYAQFTKYASGEVRNVLPIYKSKTITRGNSKSSDSNSHSQNIADLQAPNLLESTELTDAATPTPNIVKIDKKRFGDEVKATEIY